MVRIITRLITLNKHSNIPYKYQSKLESLTRAKLQSEKAAGELREAEQAEADKIKVLNHRTPEEV